MKLLRQRTIFAALAVTTAIAAAVAPSASAAGPKVSVLLNDQTGELSIIGTETADYAMVWKQPEASAPGGYVLVINTKTDAQLPNWSPNCYIGGGFSGNWQVFCPALTVKKIAFDGGALNDTFVNDTTLPSVAYGGPGLDDLEGGTGSDVFYGGADNDILKGRGGDDTLDGGAGFDTISGGLGTDIASWADASGPVTASLDGIPNDGQAGENENIPADVEGIQGGGYDDHLSGSAANDILLGGGGGDSLVPGGGDDTLRGEAANDTLYPNAGATVLDGGPGSDTLSYATWGSPVYVYQDGVANDGTLGEHQNVTSIEHLTGTAYGDDLEGTSGDDVIHGGAGNDKIDAKFGNDMVYGESGSDNILGGPGPATDCGHLVTCTQFDTDTVYGGSGNDTIDYSQRSDNLTIALDGSKKSGGSVENDTLNSIENAVGGGGNDTIVGNDAANSLNGGPGTDGIAGHGGNDYISGDGGNDYLEGDGGNDWITGGAGTDRVSYYNSTAGVVAHIGTGTSGKAGEADTIGSDVENLEGSAYNDQLYGNGGPNKLIGDNGPDLLVGNGGVDTLQGGGGADTLKTSGDGLKDSSSCGIGTDVANADKLDAVASDCETVHRS